MQGQLFGARREPTVTDKRGVLALYSRDAMIHACEPRLYVITMRGKRIPRPRMEAWFHDDPACSYQFGGGAPIYPRPFPELLHQMRVEVQHLTGERFDSCFVNVYRSGRDSIDWHADDCEEPIYDYSEPRPAGDGTVVYGSVCRVVDDGLCRFHADDEYHARVIARMARWLRYCDRSQR